MKCVPEYDLCVEICFK